LRQVKGPGASRIHHNETVAGRTPGDEGVVEAGRAADQEIYVWPQLMLTTNREEEAVVQQLNRRFVAAAVVVASVLVSSAARAAEPITIGFGMALTGGLAAAGKTALLAMQIWQDDVNAKGGLLGR
jgi:ABC-type branched-subunit amino acid transport system substrate-binding protein